MNMPFTTKKHALPCRQILPPVWSSCFRRNRTCRVVSFPLSAPTHPISSLLLMAAKLLVLVCLLLDFLLLAIILDVSIFGVVVIHCWCHWRSHRHRYCCLSRPLLPYSACFSPPEPLPYFVNCPIHHVPR